MESKDNNFYGDLSDIIRASYGSTVGTSSSESAPNSHHDHHWMFVSDPMLTTMDFSSVSEQDHRRGGFGDPFSNMRDPFLQDQLGMPSAGSASYYCFNNNSSSSGSAEISGGALKDVACFGDDAVVVGSGDNNNSCVLARATVVEDDTMMMMMMMRRAPPCNNNIILSNMIQISPKAKLPISSSTCVDSPKIVKTTSAVVSLAGNMINASNYNNKDHGLLVEQKSGGAGVQISSSRNNPAAGLRRRKSQAKKSICIPAPTAPNSRQSGEVVPSDMWAWRKYGQKPIKGSPYPRGYYRCSSSKGCPARKQVERSRTDPNMLVITYTSEHNHPWPTQRNALAGSSRSQPSKKNIINSDEPHKGTTTTLPQEEEQESNISTDNSENNNNNASVKLEEVDDGMMEKQQLKMDDDDGGFSNGSSVSPYKNNKQLLEDLFVKLGEMEAADEYDDSMMKGLINNAVDHDDDHQQIRESKGLDPFHVFDWSGDNSTRYHLI